MKTRIGMSLAVAIVALLGMTSIDRAAAASRSDAATATATALTDSVPRGVFIADIATGIIARAFMCAARISRITSGRTIMCRKRCRRSFRWLRLWTGSILVSADAGIMPGMTI